MISWCVKFGKQTILTHTKVMVDDRLNFTLATSNILPL